MTSNRRKRETYHSFVNEKAIILDNPVSILKEVLGHFGKLFSRVEEDLW